MPGLNINPGAQGNPLDALLAQHGGNLYGSTGFNVENLLAQARAGTIDPRLAALGYGPTTYDSTYQFNPSSSAIDPVTGQINLNGQRYIQLKNTGIGGPGQVIDPSKVIYNDQFGALAPSGDVAKPQDDFMAQWAPFIIAGLGSAAAIAGSAGAAGGASAAPDVSTSDLGSLGTVNGEGASAGSLGTTGGTTSGLDFGGYTGGIDPETANGMGGMGVAQNGIGSGSFMDQLTGAINNPSSLLSSNGLLGSTVGDLGSWAISHPLQAAGLLQTASGLIHRSGSSSSSSSGSKSGNGSGISGGSLNLPPVNYTPNPYLAAQIQRGYS